MIALDILSEGFLPQLRVLVLGLYPIRRCGLSR